MKKKSKTERTIQSLRSEAEGVLAQTSAALPEIKEKTPEELIQELRVHQIELEMQNEELRKARLFVEESRDKYIDLYDFAPVGYFTFTREALIKEVNLTGAALIGVERQKLINARFRRFIVPEDHEKWDRHLLTIFEPGAGKQVCELKLSRDDGSLFYVRLESKGFEVAGEVAEVHTAISDISERKWAEAVLLESEVRYRSIFEGSTDGIIAFDLTTEKFIFANKRMLELLGYTGEEILMLGVKDIHLPKDLPYVLKEFNKMATGKKTHTSSIPVLRRDGSMIYCDIGSSFLGKTVLIGFFRDITERKLIEEALRQNREDLSRAQEVGNIGSWRLDVRLNVLTWSDENYRIFGIPKGTPLTYETFLAAVHPEDRTYVDTQWKAGLRGEPYDIEHRLVVEGLVKWVREQAYLECDKDGSLLGGFGITQDITKRKQAEEALRKAHYELERRSSELEIVNKELETFSYTISHDLKAPLRSIQGFAGAITEDYGDSLDEAGRDYLLRINSAGVRMTQLIEAMMEISRLTSRELMEKTVNMSSIAEKIASELKQNGPARKVEFLIAKEVNAHGDSALTEIVLRNLLDNALKFTSKHASAKIEFGVMRMDGKNVYFVRDDGEGFGMEFAGKLFQPFQRFHAESEFPGLGIGLAIAWKIIVKHGGKIWAESKIGEGATFYFTLE